MTRVPVTPEMLRWACSRAGSDVAEVAVRVPQLPAWVRGERQPTFRQLEKLSRITHTPFGYLFLPKPPEERLPIPDYRSVSGAGPGRPSPDLLDTLHTMRRRQHWLRGALEETGADPLAFAGSARLADEPGAVGQEMRLALGMADGWAAEVRTWKDAVGELRRRIERLGIMAVINGVVANASIGRVDDGAGTSGGDFYNNQNTRVGEFFATHVLRAAMEGRIGFKEAYDLTGLHGGTFQKYARRLGVSLP